MTRGSGEDPNEVLGWLLDQSYELPPARLPEVVAEALTRVGARASCLYLADRDQMFLHPFTPSDSAERQPVDGTIAGRCYALEEILEVQDGPVTRMWVPVLDGISRLGVMSIDVPAETAVDETLRTAVRRVVTLCAELVVTKSQLTDVIEKARRRQHMSLQAEMQRGSLPPGSMACPTAAVAGMLMPAYDVAGDWFDYAVNEQTLDVAVIDSVGHELQSAMVSHLVSSALRNARRNGLTLEEAYAAADAAVVQVFPTIQFATAAVGFLELATGRFRWISAGHPPPLVVRGGRAVIEAATVPSLPIGLGGAEGAEVVVNEVALEPGDGLLLYTDGVTEGGARGKERFGQERVVELLTRNLRAGLPGSEVVRRLAMAVMDHAAFELHDDMGLVLIEYRG